MYHNGHEAPVSHPLPGSDLVGRIDVVKAREEDTLVDIARRHQIGQEEIVLANPGVDRWYPREGTEVILPSRYILPSGPRRGLVLNAPEMRLYYYPLPAEEEFSQVQAFPVAIGRMGWETPVAETTLVSKERNPSWWPPESIRREHAEQGDPLPAVVPPGPENPRNQQGVRRRDARLPWLHPHAA
jgi:L,D-transpeptidase ErfK/SrfK